MALDMRRMVFAVVVLTLLSLLALLLADNPPSALASASHAQDAQPLEAARAAPVLAGRPRVSLDTLLAHAPPSERPREPTLLCMNAAEAAALRGPLA